MYLLGTPGNQKYIFEFNHDLLNLFKFILESEVHERDNLKFQE